MQLEYIGLQKINGPLVVLEGVKRAHYEEVVEITINNHEKRMGRIIELVGDTAVIEVFKGTAGISLKNTTTKLTGHSLELALSKEILGRTFDGRARPIDGLGPVYAETKWDINGSIINPIAREYPRHYIQTGISAIDGLITLIQGQKLPIFSAEGLAHHALAVQIVHQAKLAKQEGESFAVVFAAMGVTHDVAAYFRNTFETSGILDKMVMFLNVSNDPVVERIVTPRYALTTAEYLAFEKDMQVLVILTDMTSYAEALREISSSKGEIPSRKGFPGYLYSDLASIYERAGILKQKKGSVTQIPIITMPNDDITHPIPDLTGYITEGQIVLDKKLHQKGIYPPINIRPSLSRLMKDGIGKGFTREDHPDVANQLFVSYANVRKIQALAEVIGEDALSETAKSYMVFGQAFEQQLVMQQKDKNRTLEETLEIAWKLLRLLPREELDRIDKVLLDKYYKSHEGET